MEEKEVNISSLMDECCSSCEKISGCDSYWNLTGNCRTFLRFYEEKEKEKSKK
ncbi:MAG: hypothetical protein V1851_01050 [Patescibacteria group bacterium]